MPYSGVYATYPVPGATLVQSPILSPSAFSTGAATLLVVRPNELVQLLPALKHLASLSVVIQVSTLPSHDHAQVLALRSAGLALVYSPTQERATANAVVAAHVAATGRGVIHFGEFDPSVVLGAGTAETIEPASTVQGAFAAAFAAVPTSAAAALFGDNGAPSTFIIGLGNTSALESSLPSDAALVSLSLYRPLSAASIREFVPKSAKTVVVLEQVYNKVAKWSPLFLDVVGAFAESDDEAPSILSGTLGFVADGEAAAAQLSGTPSLPQTLENSYEGGS